MCSAAMRQQFPTATEESINTKISLCLAQSSDRDGRRKERVLRTSCTAAAVGAPVDDGTVEHAGDNDSPHTVAPDN